MPDLINWSNCNANQQVPILTLAVEQAISMQAGKADLWPDAQLYILLIGCRLADTRTPRREEDCAAGRSDNCTTNLFVRGQTHFSFSLPPKVLKV